MASSLFASQDLNLNKLNKELHQYKQPKNIALNHELSSKSKPNLNFFILICILILSGLITLFYFIKTKPSKINTELFNILSSTKLDAKNNLHLIEIEGILLIISSTSNGVKLIKEIDDPKIKKDIFAKCA